MISVRPLSSVSFKESFSYAFSAACRSLVFITTNTSFLVYMFFVLKFSNESIAMIFFICALSYLVFAPLLGAFADKMLFNQKHCSFWCASSAIACGMAGILCFITPKARDEDVFWYTVVLIWLWQLLFAFNSNLFWSRLSNFSCENMMREIMASAAKIGELAGILLSLACIYIALPPLLGRFDLDFFKYFAIISAIILCISNLVMIASVHDKKIRNLSFRCQDIMSLFLGNGPLMSASLLTLLQQIFILLVIAKFIFHSYHFSTDVFPFSMVVIYGAFSQFVSLVCFKSLARLFRRRSVFIGSCFIMAAGLFLLYAFDFFDLHLPQLMTLSFCISNIGMGLSLASTLAMTADCVDYGEFKSGFRTENLIFSTQTSLLSIGYLSLIFLMLQSKNTIYYKIVGGITESPYFLVITALLCLGSVFIYNCYYRLSGNFFENIINALEQFSSNHGRKNDNKNSPVRFALDEHAIISDLHADSVEEVLQKLTERLYEIRAISSREIFIKGLQKTISINPAGIAEGIALPHTRGPYVKRMAFAIATLAKPLDFGAIDGKKCDLVFILATPDDGNSHINLLGQLSMMLNEPGFADKLRNSGSSEEIATRIIQCERHLHSA